MLPQKINAWLNQPTDYPSGLKLLEETGSVSGFVLGVLQTGADAYNRKRVVSELKAWLSRQEKPVDRPVVPDPMLAPLAPSAVSGLTAAIESKIYPLMDERAALKSQIWAVQDDARQGDRRDWAYQIKRITRQIDDYYSQIEFVQQYGYLPPNEASPMEVDDATQLMNVRTYVSRYRKKLKKLVDQGVPPTDPRFCATAALLKQYLDQKNQSELKLSKNNDSHPTRQQT